MSVRSNAPVGGNGLARRSLRAVLVVGRGAARAAAAAAPSPPRPAPTGAVPTDSPTGWRDASRHFSSTRTDRILRSLLRYIADHDDIPKLVNVLLEGTPSQKTAAAGMLVRLARVGSDRIAMAIVEAGALPLLVRLVSDGSPEQKVRAARALMHLTNYTVGVDYHSGIPNAGGIPPLVALVREGTESQKLAAAAALHGLARNGANRRAIAWAGGIPPLVALVHDGTENQKGAAAAALRNLADDEVYQVAIARAGGIPPLVALVSDGTEDQKVKAAFALRNLARREDNRLAIADAGGIPPLVALVRDGTRDQKNGATSALELVSTDFWAMNPNHQKDFVITGGVQSLVALVRDGTNYLKYKAAIVLDNLAEAKEEFVADAIVAADGITALRALLRYGQPAQKNVAESALFSLTKVSVKFALLVISICPDVFDCSHWEKTFPKFAEVRDAIQEHGNIYDFLANWAHSISTELCKDKSPETLARMLLNFKILGAAATATSNPSALAAKKLLQLLAIEVDRVLAMKPSALSMAAVESGEEMDTSEFRAMEDMKDMHKDNALADRLRALGRSGDRPALDELEIEQAQRFERWLAIAGAISKAFNAVKSEDAEKVVQLAEAFVMRLTAPAGTSPSNPTLLFNIASLEFDADDKRMRVMLDREQEIEEREAREREVAEPSAKRRRTAVDISASLAEFFGHEKVARLQLCAEDLHPLLVARYGH
jgi:vacuolar protein 8